MKYLGVDGCPAGWIAVTKHRGKLIYKICANATDLVAAFPDAKSILIDIPIGLPWREMPTRACEPRARQVLGPRRSSVFSVPCREAAHAATVADARAANIAELGKSLSAQSWNICNKIAEVDLLLRDKKLQKVVREVHPELCFWGLAGGVPMHFGKKSPEGRAERLAVLSRFEPKTQKLLNLVLQEQLRATVQADDVLDAVVAFVVATAKPGDQTTLPEKPSVDQQGLRMEMVYAHLAHGHRRFFKRSRSLLQ